MTTGRYLKRPKATPLGVWLAFLAAAGQVLLPFLLAFEIALAEPPADAAYGAAICSAGHMPAPTSPSGGGTERHAPAGGCPICQALAAGHAFIPPTVVTLAAPTNSTAVRQPSAPRQSLTALASASYRSRAPPSKV